MLPLRSKLPRDFPESLAGRGRAAPGSARRALTAWSDSLGIDWPLSSPLVLSAATVATNEAPKTGARDPPSHDETSRTCRPQCRGRSAQTRLRARRITHVVRKPSVLGRPAHSCPRSQRRPGARTPSCVENREGAHPELAACFPAVRQRRSFGVDSAVVGYTPIIPQGQLARYELLSPPR